MSSTTTRDYIGSKDIRYFDGTTDTFTRRTSTGGLLTMNKFGFEVDVCEAYGSGTISELAIRNALVDINTNKRTLVLRNGVWPVAANLTIPANINLKLPPDAILTVATGITLTINGTIEAGPYQIFDWAGTGKVVYKGHKLPEWWGAKDDSGTTDNAAAIIACVTNGGEVEFSAPGGGYYDCTTAVTVSTANTYIYSNNKAQIKQSTAETNLFTVSASNVEFRNLKLVGVDTGDNNTVWVDASAISAPGTSGAPLDGLKINNCDISGFFDGVHAQWTSFNIEGNYIYSCMKCIDAGADDAADSTGLIQNINNNKLISTFGQLAYARPIYFNSLGGTSVTHGNYCRGGGMGIEMLYTGSGITKTPAIEITDNDVDTGISAICAIIANNVIDWAVSPVGRGPQTGWYYGVEIGYEGVMVEGNTIRNCSTAILSAYPRSHILGNTIVSCGYQAAYPSNAPVDAGIVVIGGTDTSLGAPAHNGTVIIGNTFYNTTDNDTFTINPSDIILNAATTIAQSGVIVAENTSYNSTGPFIDLRKTQYSKIINNHIYNCCKDRVSENAIKTDFDASVVGNLIEGNTIINDVVGGNGANYALAVQGGNIIGKNIIVGMIGGSYIDWYTPNPILADELIIDGAGFLPTYANNAAALAANYTAGTKYMTATGSMMIVYTP